MVDGGATAVIVGATLPVELVEVVVELAVVAAAEVVVVVVVEVVVVGDVVEVVGDVVVVDDVDVDDATTLIANMGSAVLETPSLTPTVMPE